MNNWSCILTHLLILCILPIEMAHSQLRTPGGKQIPYPDRVVTQPATIHQPITTNDSTPSFYKRKTEWKKIIDAYWGPGDPYTTKLSVFNTYVSYVKANFPAFVYSKLNWDSVAAYWRAKITDSTSRGAFHVILGMLGYALNEWHAGAYDDVVEATPMTPGAPWTSGLGIQFNHDVRHFGAALTPLPDKSLLVYKVIANHPLGLERGDRVLGYEGVPWPKIFDELSEAGVGTDFLVGGCPTAKEYYRLAFAGMFWHLFDTIDVVKYGTGQTVHLPTAPLTSLNLPGPLLNCDQLPVPGVPMPSEDLLAGNVTYGIVLGTNIGYIYVRHHMDPKISSQFDAAIRALANTEGLVIDMRLDYGGRYGLEQGIARLVNFGDSTLQFRRRYSASDMQTMVPANTVSVAIPLDAGTMYDHPIAVLVGPQCRSWGDLTAHQLSYIPGVRFFGKSPTGAYSGHWWGPYPLSVSGYGLYYPDFIEVDHRFPDVQLLNREFPIDEDVWLTPDDVAKGDDTVVKRALQWINTLSYVHDVSALNPYVRPGVDSLTVTAVLTNPGTHSMAASLIIRNLTGVVQDSVAMVNDGLHGDALPGDSILGGRLKAPSTEGFYAIDLRTHDFTIGSSRFLTSMSLITTAGPVTCVGDTSSTIPQWGSTVGFRLKISNTGTTVSTPAIEGAIRPLDTAATIASSNPSFSVGDITPGEVRISSPIRIAFSTWCVGTKDIRFELLFSSNATQYWRDTITIRVVDPTGIVQEEKEIPTTFVLGQNYPNPFNPSTTIRYGLPQRSHVTLAVFNTLGQQVALLQNGEQDAGYYEMKFDAANLSSGVYFYRLQAGGFVQSKKLMMLK